LLPYCVNFTDLSTGNPAEWRWDLGNGTVSTLQNPSTTYITPGLYTVKLWVKSGNHTDSIIKNNYIEVFKSPTVDFNATNTSGCNPLTVQFTDLSAITDGHIMARQWDFGDGLLSAEQNPGHTYNLTGNFNVTLKVTAVNGCMSALRKTSYINNHDTKAAFRNWGFSNCSPNKIVFQNESTGNGNLNFVWYFGDGTSTSETSPVHIYSAAGVYTVKLVTASEFGCRDSVTKNLTIRVPPALAFYTNTPLNCQLPAAVQFINQTTGDYTYEWSFGDSTRSAAAHPVHQYINPGIYDVKLVVKYAGGCRDSLQRNNYITVQKIMTAPIGLPDSGCVPFSKQFRAQNNSNDSIINYTWHMGNGILLQGSSPTHTFTVAGSYDVSVITTSLTGCKDTMTIPGGIKTGHKPVARFSADIRNTCASTPVNFTDESTGNITSWEWDFGDGTVSSERNPSHVYEDTGWIKVILKVWSGGCVDEAIYHRYIYIKPAIAKYKAVGDCNDPNKKFFYNFSLGTSGWSWDFGDGHTSTEHSPAHIFPGPGNYRVILRVWNDSTGCSQLSQKVIEIAAANTGFAAADSIVCTNDTVLLHAIPHPDIVRYSWDFGDGTYYSSTEPDAQHAYSGTGYYTVTLNTTDILNCVSVLSKSAYIKVNGVKARFAVASGYVCINTPVVFIDSSALFSTPVKKWEWDYGDGSEETVFSPPFVHSYPLTGWYTPFVKLTDSLGCVDSFRFTMPLRAEKLSSFFFISDSVSCPGYNLKFVCPYSTPGTMYLWDFGDGTTSSRQIPFHAYANEGVYTVKLYLFRSNGCIDSTIHTNAVRVKQTKAVFTVSDSFSTCPPLLVNFTSNAQNANEQFWIFGDSTATNTANPAHYYSYPGEYKAMLIAKGPGTCADSMLKTIIIQGPKGTIISDRQLSCKPYRYHFTAHTENTVSLVWDFGDGVIERAVDSAVAYTYSDSGSFIPKIILTDQNGCRVPVISKDTLTNIYVKPAFSVSDSIICGNAPISFADASLSNDEITGFTWNFGDGNSSNLQSTSHQFRTTGTFYPSLQITTFHGCSSLLTAPFPIEVRDQPAFTIQTNGSGCAPFSGAFTAVTNDPALAVTTWRWDFGNGDSSDLQNPPIQNYTIPGQYMITLSGQSYQGCTGYAQLPLSVYNSPVITVAGSKAICRGQASALQASGAEKYQWHTNSNISCDTCAIITVQPLVDTQYIVTGLTAFGCSSTDTVNIRVHQPVQIEYKDSFTLCRGQHAAMKVSGAANYKWHPSDGLNYINTASPVASPDTSTVYTVIGSDSYGCFSDTGKIRVNVHNYPAVRAGDDKTVTAGTPVLLEASYSGDVDYVRWTPNDNLSRFDSSTILVKPTENTEYTVNVKNEAGCSAFDKVSVFVLCNQKNVFIPNLFSPNNDGVNDVFYPRGTGLLKVKTLRIFNRWGETVFEKRSFNANDPAAGWDGTYKGARLTADVFVYTLDLICENNAVMSLKGNISLVQ
jgi:gliding motility-associated-like protein